MSRYFGKEKMNESGIPYYHLLWDRHEQYYYVSKEGDTIIIWCSLSPDGNMEKICVFSENSPDSKIEEYVSHALDHLVQYYADILKEFKITDLSAPKIYTIPETQLVDRSQPDENRIYQIDLSETIRNRKKVRIEQLKESKGLNDSREASIEEIYLLWDQNDYETALEKSKELLEKSLQMFGKKSRAEIHALLILSYAYSNLGKYALTVSIDEEVYRYHLDQFEDLHPCYEIGMLSLIHHLEMLEDYWSAHKYLKEYFEYCNEKYGIEDEKTLYALKKVVQVLPEIGLNKPAYKTAVLYYLKCMEIYGNEEIETLKALDEIAYLNESFRFYDQAMELNKYIYTILIRT